VDASIEGSAVAVLGRSDADGVVACPSPSHAANATSSAQASKSPVSRRVMQAW
jgi:hypothetical protein